MNTATTISSQSWCTKGTILTGHLYIPFPVHTVTAQTFPSGPGCDLVTRIRGRGLISEELLHSLAISSFLCSTLRTPEVCWGTPTTNIVINTVLTLGTNAIGLEAVVINRY